MEHTTHYLAGDGSVRPWDTVARDAVRDYLRDSARQAMRTLAFAHKELPPDTPEVEEELHERRRHPHSVRTSRKRWTAVAAGIEVKMITGDNVETARPSPTTSVAWSADSTRRSTPRTRLS